MLDIPVRYQCEDEDSARWDGFDFRPGDIVISTRSKSGTTWMQQICALLIFQTPELPAPLGRLSPWLDWLITPREQVVARLEAQQHRRFIKTHTPLDGLPSDERVTYIVVGRHPLDMAVSLYYQSGNINRDRVRELTSQYGPEDARKPRPALHEWLVSWIDSQDRPEEQLDSLPGAMWHLSDAWVRRTSLVGEAPAVDGDLVAPDDRRSPGARPAVLLVHYDDLCADLGGQMSRLAGLLGIDVAEEKWPDLVRAATFDHMRARAAAQAPCTGGILKDPAAFFRRGCPGAGDEALEPGELARYYQRTKRLAPPDLLTWLHRDRTVGYGRGIRADQGWDARVSHGGMESAAAG